MSQSRLIDAIDVSAEPDPLAELAPGPYVRDITDLGETGRPGLEYPGRPPIPGDIVRAS